MLNRMLRSLMLAAVLAVFTVCTAQAQQSPDVNSVRWKSEEQVRALLGEPNSIHGPVGTHAAYSLWKYDDFTVAFANKRAFHLFHKDSLKKVVVEQKGEPG